MCSSIHDNSKTKNILVLREDFIQGIDNTTIYAEKIYLINFTENNKKSCLSKKNLIKQNILRLC